MDNTTIDFNYSLEQIKRELPDNYTEQQVVMNSGAINSMFSNIETSLNILYENTRHLENAMAYADSFLNLKIKEYSQDIKETLKAIEDIRDINKNSSYMEYVCNFVDDSSIKKDRNNEVISTAVLKEGGIMLAPKNSSIAKWNTISKKALSVAYSSNLDKIKTEKYRAYYIEEKIAPNGILETITITLDNPTEINYIDIKNVNCKIENMRLVYLNGIEDYVEYESGIVPNSIVTQIKFDVRAKIYTTSKYYMDKKKLTDDVWKKVKEFEYKYALDINSKLEMEEVIARIHEGKKQIYNNNITDKNNIEERNMYSYMFGIDSIEIKKIEQETDSCFVSNSINTGSFSEKEYLQLHVEVVVDENATIEYSILDGDIEKPILPYGEKTIKNEKLFPILNLRLSQGETDTVTIKNDGLVTDISLDDAKLQLLSRFSASYFPALVYNYTPINKSIRIKATIRRYGKAINNSYIKAIKVRKYGGDVPWTDM